MAFENLMLVFSASITGIIVGVRLRGREKAMSDFANRKLDSLFRNIEEEVQIKKEGKIKKSPRGLEVMIAKK
ncbi:MAG: hypothetical protein O2U61_07025 [Candidatus Bathyarchaeota archaeon]|nr:hypothetical protein [Candidatus Bathyarchaeota archaeon]